ncbi:MAG: transposase [Candidatus Omnitrophica bacterium]|jgi:transposase|nr:transposase [Candidatus Omnitrophota bacterium]
MIIRELKLKLTKKQEAELERWLFHLTSVYNWTVRKIELDAKDKIYYGKFDLINLIKLHSKKLKIPAHVISGVLVQAWISWQRCFKKLSKKPHFKGRRNKLNSIPFPDSIKSIGEKEIKLLGLGKVRFFKQDIPEGKIKCSRIIKRASGWYLLITIDTNHKFEVKENAPIVGIDTGFHSLLTLSDGVKFENPRELKLGAKRLAQATRGRNYKLIGRIQEHQANRRKDRNHKISRNLVENYSTIYITNDNLKGQQKKFGKSILEASIGNLIKMINYKSAVHADRKTILVNSKFTTMICSSCGAKTGPTGFSGLAVREWNCACGAHHDRDINAAINVLHLGLGYNLKAPAMEQLTGMSI